MHFSMNISVVAIHCFCDIWSERMNIPYKSRDGLSILLNWLAHDRKESTWLEFFFEQSQKVE